MRKITLLLISLFVAVATVKAQSTHQFTLKPEGFMLDGKPFQIISGEMHPARIPHEYWRHRIKMAKAMGCNTIAAYVFWNYQETSPGVFDYSTGNHNVAEFIKICKEEGMWVMLRPGPYVCAEWDFGGLPSYLLKIPDIKVRCMDPRYMEPLTKYVTSLAKEIAPLQCVNGGPILMVQIENEYGSYGNDKTYLNTLKDMWLNNGIKVPFYTADGATPYMLDAGHVTGAAVGLDSGSGDEDFDAAKKADPTAPAFSSETYPGWLTHWGENWATADTPGIRKELTYLLKNKKSFNLYVVHGGTNFGYTAGANAGKATEYQPDVTSYDYDAPIDEQGNATPKYYMMRKLIGQYVGYKIPDVPKPVKTIVTPAIKMQVYSNIWQNLPAAIQSPQPKPMEAFDQNQGLILYRTKLIGHKSGWLTITEPHDYALVFLNGKYIDSVYRDGGKWSVKLPESDVKDPVLDILVEGMGHINFAQYIIDRKGITDRVVLNGMTLMNWDIFKLPLDEQFISNLKTSAETAPNNKGTFFKGEFTITKTGDTYFDMSKYAKGVVFVNGHNLGRYWNRGPQKHLYCPASWLKQGKNEITVFDMQSSTPADVATVATLK
ncbi:beta-galactosidase [Mucilaginibacter pineti]|uniref:Beta-galactosidase n=1 Tax=Mucilaginibacter pineti TaxID=1391627 RepID=A0A1G6WWP1_9SPHI|nr:beta-galactosidase family protein [Mucilaginibacter pineti]SDD70261.1 beta-galactosidase [Mucilaginibacter pineti]